VTETKEWRGTDRHGKRERERERTEFWNIDHGLNLFLKRSNLGK